jgi:hypothetical protein
VKIRLTPFVKKMSIFERSRWRRSRPVAQSLASGKEAPDPRLRWLRRIALDPIEASKTAVRYVCNTSALAVRGAEIAVVRRRLRERVKACP